MKVDKHYNLIKEFISYHWRRVGYLEGGSYDVKADKNILCIMYNGEEIGRTYYNANKKFGEEELAVAKKACVDGVEEGERVRKVECFN